MQKCKNSRGRESEWQEGKKTTLILGIRISCSAGSLGTFDRLTDDMFAGIPFFLAFLLFLPPFSAFLSTTFAYHFTSEHFSDHFLKYFCCRIVQSYRHKANICIANKRATVEEIFNIRN